MTTKTTPRDVIGDIFDHSAREPWHQKISGDIDYRYGLQGSWLFACPDCGRTWMISLRDIEAEPLLDAYRKDPQGPSKLLQVMCNLPFVKPHLATSWDRVRNGYLDEDKS